MIVFELFNKCRIVVFEMYITTFIIHVSNALYLLRFCRIVNQPVNCITCVLNMHVDRVRTWLHRVREARHVRLAEQVHLRRGYQRSDQQKDL